MIYGLHSAQTRLLLPPTWTSSPGYGTKQAEPLGTIRTRQQFSASKLEPSYWGSGFELIYILTVKTQYRLIINGSCSFQPVWCFITSLVVKCCFSCRMLDDFGHEMDHTQSRLDNVMKKLAKVSHMTSGNLPGNTLLIQKQSLFYLSSDWMKFRDSGFWLDLFLCQSSAAKNDLIFQLLVKKIVMQIICIYIGNNIKTALLCIYMQALCCRYQSNHVSIRF